MVTPFTVDGAAGDLGNVTGKVVAVADSGGAADVLQAVAAREVA